MDALWVERQHAGANARAAEELSWVVEQDFVVIHVAVIERDAALAGSVSKGRGAKVEIRAPGVKGGVDTGEDGTGAE